jgi:hypothetical protein
VGWWRVEKEFAQITGEEMGRWIRDKKKDRGETRR